MRAGVPRLRGVMPGRTIGAPKYDDAQRYERHPDDVM